MKKTLQITIGITILASLLFFIPLQKDSAGTGRCASNPPAKRLHLVLGDSLEEAKQAHGLENCVNQEFKLYVL